MAKKISIPPMLKKVMSYIVAKPATTNYPYEELKLANNFRGQPAFDINLCVGCGTCSRECPAQAIEMVVLLNGKKYPQFNLAKCIFCYCCAENCPKHAIKNSSVFELATSDKSSLIIKPQLTV